ncbi:MAG: chemotaxis protein CheB [Acidobacteria bacterium]|nr:MAG: chemotaxis protein CheB [Acidobacteriota bacterium]
MARRNIVVIGASAGGIEVLQTILAALPWDFPGSVFIVLHTSQESPGLLPEILNRCSKLPVLYAVHGAPILPARVYVAPAGRRHMMLDRGKVRMEAGPRENRNRPSIDALFRSASYAYGSQVIGVVLTGNLDDGSAGVAAIKARDGVAIVQDPDDAFAPSMPASAIDATDVDYVLAAEAIGPKLIELVTSNVAENLQAISNGTRNIAATGHTYSCPECGGVLEEIQENELLRLRCRVGHIYSPESFLADQTEAVERALWAAIRSMEEQTEYADRLATSSRQKNRAALAHRFSDKAETSRENAAVLRELLQKTTDEIFDIPQPIPEMEPRTRTE